VKKVFVVYNPVSGRKKMRNLESLIKKRLEKFKCKYTWYETCKEGNDFSKMRTGYDLILAIGGDGTVSEVATYMVKNKVKAALGVVGTGSTNLLALSLRIPVVDSLRAVNFALKKEPRAIDVGIANDRTFLIAAGKGYDNVFMLGATRELKRKMGFFAYVWSFITTYFAHPSCEYKIEIDGKTHKVQAKTVLVFNFFRLSGGKFMPDDGVFEVVAVNPRGVLDILVMLWRRKKHPKAQFFTGKKIKIHSAKDRGYQLDGDVFEGGEDLEIEIVERGVRVIY